MTTMKPWTFLRVVSVLLVTLLCFCTVSVSGSKIYKWRDAQGKLHFSDSAVNVPAEILNDASKEYRPDPSKVTLVPSVSTDFDKKENWVISRKFRGDDISIPYVSREGSASRVIINVKFNDSVTAPILVDTGSPGLVITSKLANRLGLLDEAGSNLMVLISGLGGRQNAVRTIVNKISLGGIAEEFIPAHIVSNMSEAYDGLIGMDVLSGYRLTIDPANKRLIANAVASTRDLPAGRDKVWWQARYREFRYYRDFWTQQVNLVGESDSPYARMAPGKRERMRKFIVQQQDEAQNLFGRLESFARWNNVPRHWRR